MATGLTWQAWAPPLDPPTAGGLPEDAAQAIADAYWATDPHLCATLQWEAYAATLPPAPAVSQVSTGAQSVAYSPPVPGGEIGSALSRAAWHRSLMASLSTAPLVLAPAGAVPGIYAPPPWRLLPPGGWWEPDPPTASFTWAPASPGPGVDVTFDGSASAPGDAPISRYDWTFSPADYRPDAGPVVTWRSGAPGTYTIRLVVTDENGLTGAVDQELTI